MNMSSDDQFTALGPAAIGFQTDGTNITVGADITGNTVGVQGSGPIGVNGVGSLPTTTNPTIGVNGSSQSGYGVHGFSDVGVGVNGSSKNGVGVFGESTRGRGGIFASGRPSPDASLADAAQLQLRPQVVFQSQSPIPPPPPRNEVLPLLPKDGQAGDLFAAQINSDLGACQLWFCVNSPSADGTQPAQWSQVLLGSPISGGK
jgi:hypothetical protein